MKKLVKVNLGCGRQALAEWINLDVDFMIWLSKHSFLKRMLFKLGLMSKVTYNMPPYPSYVKRWDIRRGLPFKDSSVDFIYTSHFLEHITRQEALKILRECFRVLKPRGRIRVVVPDLEIFARKYLGKDTMFFETLSWAVRGPTIADNFLEYLFSGWINKPQKRLNIFTRIRWHYVEGVLHYWEYDFDSLSHLLRLCGFFNISRESFQKGKVPDIELLDNRPSESLFVEAEKGT